MTDSAAYSDPQTALTDALQLHKQGRGEEAKSLLRRARALAPRDGNVLFQIGALSREMGDLPAAADHLEQASALLPDAAEIWLELTRIRHDQAEWTACAAAERTLAIDAGCVEAELMHAVARFALQDYPAATVSIERVAASLPNDAGVQIFHARCLMALKRHADAQAPARKAVALTPESRDAQYLLGASLKRTGQNEAAETALLACLKADSRYPDALNDLADIFIARGDTQAALQCLRTSHAAQPFNLDAISALCFYTAFDPNSDAKDLFAINRSWSEELHEDAGPDTIAAPAVLRGGSRIHVAYLAYDLFDHVTSWFLEPVLARHDRDRFRISGYYGNDNPDQVTERLGTYTESWQSVAEDSIAQTAERIRSDGVDILVLASFYRGQDRRVLAHRCAPL